MRVPAQLGGRRMDLGADVAPAGPSSTWTSRGALRGRLATWGVDAGPSLPSLVDACDLGGRRGPGASALTAVVDGRSELGADGWRPARTCRGRTRRARGRVPLGGTLGGGPGGPAASATPRAARVAAGSGSKMRGCGRPSPGSAAWAAECGAESARRPGCGPGTIGTRDRAARVEQVLDDRRDHADDLLVAGRGQRLEAHPVAHGRHTQQVAGDQGRAHPGVGHADHPRHPVHDADLDEVLEPGDGMPGVRPRCAPGRSGRRGPPGRAAMSSVKRTRRSPMPSIPGPSGPGSPRPGRPAGACAAANSDSRLR